MILQEQHQRLVTDILLQSQPFLWIHIKSLITDSVIDAYRTTTSLSNSLKNNSHVYLIYINKTQNNVDTTEVQTGVTFSIIVGCFLYKGFLRQYFCLYRVVSQREEKKRKGRGEKKYSNNSLSHLMQVQ